MNENPFAGMNDAKAFGDGGEYIESPGDFVCEIDAMKIVYARSGAVLVFAEFKILESDSPEHPVGSNRCWCVDLKGKYPESSKGDLRKFMAAVMQQEEGTFDFEKEAPEMLGAAQPFTGSTVALKVRGKKKADGGTFPKHKWSEHTS